MSCDHLWDKDLEPWKPRTFIRCVKCGKVFRDFEHYVIMLTKDMPVESVLDVGTGMKGVVAEYYWRNYKRIKKGYVCDIWVIKPTLDPFWIRLKMNALDLLKVLGPKSVDVVQACFPKGTRVFGSLKPIEQLKQGDIVLGISGKVKVLKTFTRKYVGEIVTIYPRSLPPISVTPEHPILVTQFRRVHRKSHPYHIYEWVRTNLKWKPASELNTCDWLVIPRPRSVRPHYIRLHVSHGHNWRKNRELKIIKITPRIAKIFGLWVAEGSVSRYVIRFSLGKHEKELSLELQQLIRSELGLHTYEIEEKSQSVRTVYICNKDLARFLKDNFGTGAHNKRIPEWLYSAPEDVIRGFIEGWWKGDGDFKKPYYMRIATVSEKLALGSLMLFYKLGICPSIEVRKVKDFYSREATDRLVWLIVFSQRVWNNVLDKAGRKPYQRSRVDEKFVYIPIKAIKRKKVKTTVYNIQTSDGTYCVPFVVHNCGFLEHLKKDDGYKFLDISLKLARKLVIVSGAIGLHGPTPDYKVKMDGNPYHYYHSTWSHEEFHRLGWETDWEYFKRGESYMGDVIAWKFL